jgi:hypothetical protein
VKVARLVSDREDEPDEPVKLLELNTDTLPTGIVPVYFGPSGEIPFPSLVIEVTESEYRQIETRELSLPGGWRPAETLFERNWER